MSMYKKNIHYRPFHAYIVDSSYVRYLQGYDSKVVNVDYGKQQIKPFIGPLFEIEGIKFYAPITSPKQKYIDLNDSLTFFNLIPETQNKVVGTLLIGNMIPIPSDKLVHINYDHMEKYLSSDESRNLGQYGHLIELQLRAANQNCQIIKKKAKICFHIKKDHPDYAISNFCNEFGLLIDSSKDYFKKSKSHSSVRKELEDIKSQTKYTKQNTITERISKSRHR